MDGLGTLAVLLIALAFYYSAVHEEASSSSSMESQIVSSWRAIIKAGWSSPNLQKKSKIAVGVNVNADLIISGTDVLRKLEIGPSGHAVDNDVLESISDYEETFSFSLKNGAAIERIFAKREDFEKVLEAANSLEKKQYYVGGNAALAALMMAANGKDLQVLLVGPCGPRVRSLLPSNVIIPETSMVATDEVHLIMEYKRDERWGTDQAKIATRFITSYDVSNTEMTLLPTFAESVQAFAPDAVFFSGLHLLDGQPANKIGEQLTTLKDQFNKLPSDTPIHLELASMADSELIKSIYGQVLSSVHSLGLNEQELSFMSAVNSGPHPEVYIDEGYPELGAVADILYWILMSSQSQDLSSTLGRVHFHSLAFHIVAVRQGSWTNSAAAVAAGTRIAGRQACDDGRIVDEKVELRVPKAFALSINYPPLRQRIVTFNPREPVVTWTRGNVEFFFSPVLVCKNPVKTVGLGDAISSTGFLYSQYVSSR